MPERNEAALDFLLTRRSRPAKLLGPPWPDAAALEPVLRAALRVPDHGKLEPWRLLVLGEAALARLAVAVPAHGQRLGRSLEDIEKQAALFAGSGRAVAVVASPVDSEKIPAIEQTLSAGAVCAALVNGALAAGWGASWMSGWPSHDADFVAETLDVVAPEWVAGLVFLGTERSAPPERPRPDPAAKVSWIET